MACSAGGTDDEFSTSISNNVSKETINTDKNRLFDGLKKGTKVGYFHYLSKNMDEETRKKVDDRIDGLNIVEDASEIVGLYNLSDIDQTDWNVDFLDRVDVFLDIHDDGRFTAYEYQAIDLKWDTENELLLNDGFIEYSTKYYADKKYTGNFYSEEEVGLFVADEIEEYTLENKYRYSYLDEDNNVNIVDGHLPDLFEDIYAMSGFIVEDDGEYKFEILEDSQLQGTLNKKGEIVFTDLGNRVYRQADALNKPNFFGVTGTSEEEWYFGGFSTFDADFFHAAEPEDVPFPVVIGDDGHLLSVYQIQIPMNQSLEEREALAGTEQHVDSYMTHFKDDNDYLQYLSLIKNDWYVTPLTDVGDLANEFDEGTSFKPEVAFRRGNILALKDNQPFEYDENTGEWDLLFIEKNNLP